MATVSGAADTSVSWGVNGRAGGDLTSGTIASDGRYTAPQNLPAPATVQITATSHANTAKSATANITVLSDVVVGPPQGNATVELGATQSFQAAVSSAGHPNTAVRWSVSGAACAMGCGSVDANGDFTAPQILPSPASVTLTATSAADATKLNSIPVVITSNFILQLSAPGSVTAGGSAALTAALTPVPGSNPSSVLSWSLTGAGCNGAACGTLTVVSTQSSQGNSTTDQATYTAPTAVAPPNSILITVTPLADPSKKAQASITLQPNTTSMTVSPATATLATNHRITLAATTSGASTILNWSVNGVTGGSVADGQICAVGSSPCRAVTTANSLEADYIAPGAIPGSNPVLVRVANAADATQGATAQITIINHVLVSVMPGNVMLPPLGVQGFTASVLGASDPRVVWQVQGAGCVGGVCGAINSSGTFTAPASAPAPDAIQVVAISSDDTSQSGIATVTISTGANILTLHPASVYAGGADGFTLRAEGSGFNTANPGSGSTIFIAGTARLTTCVSGMECSAPVTPADVTQPGSVTVQVRNPDGTVSNAQLLLVVAPGQGAELISLTNSVPVAAGENIVVVNPTTAGVDGPGFKLDISVAALGTFLPATNTCNLGGSPIPLQRPASGIASADICIFSQSSFDTSMSYTVSGTGDVAVIAKQPAGLGIIHLTLQVPADALPGSRTIFIHNNNLDETAASGVLEIQ